jgi:coenzyme F420-dependent glucose-6-phosphate dehydrogenase
MQIGYSLSSEEHSPLDLVRHATAAEEAGFEFALISDHFHPWIDRQGQSPFVWSVIGAIAVSTERMQLGTGVTCPMIRNHPALVAQAAATAGALMPNRFFLGLGTGENLNEHILGDRWPSPDERQEMLAEAVEIIRGLWEGELFSYEGAYYTVDRARLYTLPDEPVPIVVAASGPEAARLAAEIGDGLVSTAPEQELVDAFLDAGGRGPRYGQLTVCWATSEADARRTALEWWPNAALKGPLSQELALPTYFEEAAATVTEDEIADVIPCGPDLDAHLERIESFAEAGFDHVYLHQVGPDQAGFLDAFHDVLQEARKLDARRASKTTA